MKPDLDNGSLPAEYVYAEIRRAGAALLVSHLASLLRAHTLPLGSIVWNDGLGAHDRREWHSFHVASAGASATLRISDDDLLALMNDERIAESPVGVLVRDCLDELARTAPVEAAA